MKIELQRIPVRKVIAGYKDSAEEGVVAYDGKLDIRPKYQREFVYKDKQRNAVIKTIKDNFPLNVMYWMIREDGGYEVLDGQQRTISIGQYVNGDFSLNEKYFHNLHKEEQDQILNYELMIYFCEGTDKERLDWFRIINIAGEKLTDQEIRNAVYTGPWLSDAKLKFSKSNCAAYLLANDGGQLVSGSPIRQEYLETALSWISGGEVTDYMAKHQHDKNADELWRYFRDVIAWVRKTFPHYRKEMAHVNWGALYNEFKNKVLNAAKLEDEVYKLYSDPYVKNPRGIFEYILGDSFDTKLLEVRFFDETTKRVVYAKQTKEAGNKETSNCPDCALGHDANKSKIWSMGEMDADHVAAWSKGGSNLEKNCEMLCIRHNRAKGNR